ncbi:hypothetical protein [Dactylosporangium sp. CA-092794]|uniref:hypothetical protein n=1 Tax=Dactylosporangium sp. CA-092794 TaxID=3239929 RepID=UPI003D8C2412
MNTRIALSMVVPGIFAAVALAGCSDDTPVDIAEPPATTVPASSPAPAAAPSSAAPTSAAPSAGASGPGCPVTAAVLEKAFKASPEIMSALVLGKGLNNISCYAGWATANTQPTDVDVAVVVFKYDAAKKTWVAQSGGTDGVCRYGVPADIATHLKGCQN